MSKYNLSIKDKKILITGAGGYFGQTIVKELNDLGAKVIAIVHSDKLEQFLKSENIKGVELYKINLYEKDTLSNKIKSLLDDHSKIDVLINNAYHFSQETGFNTAEAKLETMPDDYFFKGMESGQFWPFVLTKLIGNQMLLHKAGSIINISSMYGVVAPDEKLYTGKDIFNPISYSMAKSAVLALTRYTASFWGKHGIRCNAISPGAFPNTSGDSYNSNDDQEMLDRLKQKTCLNRVGEPEDLIGAIVLLASNASSYITGQNIVIDGGWTII
ncbi:hypothetical protein BVY03_03320 [bacterium K02(2017)]|nr:hypothetical protein BVY03_03320 [bacterium K02(2017)]